MKELYKMVEWQGGCGLWYCNSVQKLATNASAWWFPSRVWGMNLSEFAIMLKDKYGAKLKMLHNDFYDNSDSLLFYWEKEDGSKCHQFVLDTNKVARQKKVMI